MKLRQIVDQNLHIALMDLNSKDIPMTAAHILANISDKIEQEVATFNKVKFERAKALCIKKPKEEVAEGDNETAEAPLQDSDAQATTPKKKSKSKTKGEAALESIKNEKEMVPDLDEKGFFKFTPENQAIINKEVEELLEKEIEMPKVKMKYLEHVKISTSNFSFLRPLFEIE